MGLILHNKQNKDTGRLGNKLFQAASTIGIATRNNMGYLFPECDYYNYLNGTIPTADIQKLDSVEITEEGFHYSEINIPDRELNYNLNGYFQSVKYWEHCEDNIKKYFQPNFFIKSQVRQKYGQILENYDTVSIHVRRGDYIDLSHFHVNLSMDYYLNAMKTVFNKREYKFLIFSDDIEWCKKQTWNSHDILFIEGNSEIIDFHLMSSCTHNIIANSSFSWWAQYLNKNEDKMVVAPKEWFTKNVGHDTKDLYLPNWIVI